MKDEPVMTVAAAVTAVLGLLTAFGLALTPDQQVAIAKAVPFVTAAVVLVGNWIARSKVTPDSKLIGGMP